MKSLFLLHVYRKDIARLETIIHAKKQAPAPVA